MTIKHIFHFGSTTDIHIEETGDAYFPVSLAFDGVAMSEDGFETPLRAGFAMTRDELAEIRDTLDALLNQPVVPRSPRPNHLAVELDEEWFARLAAANGLEVSITDVYGPTPSDPAQQGGVYLDLEMLNHALSIIGLRMVPRS